MGVDIFEFSVNFIKMVAVFLLIVQAVPVLVWAERRVSAFIQDRLGPNRVGPLGLLQLLADAVKFLTKEEFYPRGSVSLLYYVAPVFILIPTAVGLAAIPLATPIHVDTFTWLNKTWGPYDFAMQGYVINIGIIFVFAASSLATYGVLMAGWASKNKYSLFGALRASAQMISYELTLTLSIIGIFLLYQTIEFNTMIHVQEGPLRFVAMGKEYVFAYLPNWGIFFQPLGALLFFIATFAESNRMPFDLAETESELVAGFHTEYGGFKMLMFYIGEYGHMIVASSLISIMYLGGYALPVPSWTAAAVYNFVSTFVGSGTLASSLTALIFFTSMMIKVGSLLFIFIWVRWTLPRFRYDSLMSLGWKTLLPWSLANTVITAVVIYLTSVK